MPRQTPRLLIFNLPPQADVATVRALVDACRLASPVALPDRAAPAIALHTIPGAERELFAVVHLPDTRSHARALARHLNGCRQVGGLPVPRPLWSWLPAMAWG